MHLRSTSVAIVCVRVSYTVCGGTIALLTGIEHGIPDHAHRLAGSGLRLSVGARAEDAPIVHLHLDRAVLWGVVRTEAQTEVGHLLFKYQSAHKKENLNALYKVVVGETIVGVARE